MWAKKKKKKKVGFGLSLGIIPVGSNAFLGKKNAKCRQPHLPIRPCWCLIFGFFNLLLPTTTVNKWRPIFPASQTTVSRLLAGESIADSWGSQPRIKILLWFEPGLCQYWLLPGPVLQSFSDLVWPQHYNSKTNLCTWENDHPPPPQSGSVLGVTLASFFTHNLFLHLRLSPQLYLFWQR